MADIEELLKRHISTEVENQSKKNIDSLRLEVIEKALEALHSARPIVVTNGKKVSTVDGPNHEMTDEVLCYIGARIPLLLVGPAGSGKTHIAILSAKLLGIPYYSISVNEQTSKSDFLGYNDANGEVVKTNFRKAYEDGGVFIIDEIDAGNPNILTVVNSALSNDTCPFPDGMVERHKDFVCVCTANTFGEGENIQYIGRNILDAATRDRFASLYVDYSPMLETLLVPTFRPMLLELREHFKKNNVLQVISTRAGIRLQTMKEVKGKLSQVDICSMMNLQQEASRDSNVLKIMKKYAVS